MRVAVEVRGRFYDLDDVTVVPEADNAWLLRIPVDANTLRRVRRRAEPEEWDGAIFALDDLETEPAVADVCTPSMVSVHVWVV